MEQPSKFTFDAVFDVDDGSVVSSDGQAGPGWYTGQQIEALREESFDAGIAEGEARERATTEHRQAEALEAITAGLTAIAELHVPTLERVADEATNLAVAIARKVSPALMRRQPLAELEAMLREFLTRLIDEPRVVVRVPDALIDPLSERIDGLAAGCGFAGRVVLLPDAELSGADCRMEWADGGVDRKTDDIWRDVEAGITRLLQAPDHAADGVSADARTADVAPTAPAPATDPVNVPGAEPVAG